MVSRILASCQDEKYIELIESCFPKILEKYEDVHSRPTSLGAYKNGNT